jgi:hypothetical protein
MVPPQQQQQQQQQQQPQAQTVNYGNQPNSPPFIHQSFQNNNQHNLNNNNNNNLNNNNNHLHENKNNNTKSQFGYNHSATIGFTPAPNQPPRSQLSAGAANFKPTVNPHINFKPQ